MFNFLISSVISGRSKVQCIVFERPKKVYCYNIALLDFKPILLPLYHRKDILPCLLQTDRFLLLDVRTLLAYHVFFKCFSNVALLSYNGWMRTFSKVFSKYISLQRLIYFCCILYKLLQTCYD